MHFENSTEACCHSNSQICVFAIFTYFGAEKVKISLKQERHCVNLQYGIQKSITSSTSPILVLSTNEAVFTENISKYQFWAWQHPKYLKI